MTNIEDDFIIVDIDYNFQDFLEIKLKQIKKFQFNQKELSDFKSLMKSLWHNMNQNDKKEFFIRFIS